MISTPGSARSFVRSTFSLWNANTGLTSIFLFSGSFFDGAGRVTTK